MNNATLSKYKINSYLSLFKLPAFFILVLFLYEMSVFAFHQLTAPNYAWSDEPTSVLSIIIEQIVGNLVYYLCYFLITLIMFIDGKLYQVTKNNLLLVLSMCIVFCFVDYALWRILSFLFNTIYDNDNFYKMDYSYITLLFQITNLLGWLIRLLFLIGIIKFISKFNKNQRKPYQFDLSNHKNLFAFLFATIFIIPFLMVLLVGQTCLIDLVRDIMGNGFDSSISVIMLIFIVMYFLLVFLSVENAFVCKFKTIPFKLLFKSVGWSYLYLFIFNIVAAIIFVLLFFWADSYMNHSNYYIIIVLIIFSLLIHLFASWLAIMILTRKAVEKYFLEN